MGSAGSLVLPFSGAHNRGMLRIMSAPGVADAQTVKQLIAHEFLSSQR